ncbi:hypothetical protein KQX54_012461, partial [Cotesia glomerata]
MFDRYKTLDESVTTLNGGICRVLDSIAPERTIKVSRRLGLLKTKSSVNPLNLDVEGLNDYFVSIGGSCVSDDLLLAACMCGDGDQQFTSVEITISDVEKNLKRISTGAVGPDGIPIG